LPSLKSEGKKLGKEIFVRQREEKPSDLSEKNKKEGGRERSSLSQNRGRGKKASFMRGKKRTSDSKEEGERRPNKRASTLVKEGVFFGQKAILAMGGKRF